MKKSFFTYVKAVYPFTRGCRGSLVLYLVVCVVEAFIGAFLPIFTSKLILALTNSEIEQLIYTAIFVFIVEILDYFVLFLKSFLDQKIYSVTLVNLQVSVARETLKLEVSEIDKNTSGYFIDRLNKDTSDISDLFSQYVYYFSFVVSNIGVLVAVFILNKYLFIYSLLSMFILYFINRKRILKQFEVRKKTKVIQEKKTSLIGEIVRGMRDIKVLNASNSVLSKTRDKIEESASEEIKLIKIRRMYNLIECDVRTIFNFFFVIVGCLLYQKTLLTIPAFLIIFNYQTKIRGLLSGIVQISEYNKTFMLASERIFDIVGGKFKKEKFGKKNLKKLSGNIEFSNVSFSYGDKKIIDNMNFVINSNERVGFVGRSGAGKTTIFNLITKLYSDFSGDILFDNYKISELSQDSLRNNMSIITQSPYIFNFSIKDNLLLAKSDATMDEIREACRMACIDDYIMSLPEQYDSMLGENGIILSGGQKQRLAIARALLMKTEIILFDEATSALDNETQDEIQKAIDNLKGEYTILIIAHRLSTVVDCDKIFVVDEGHVVDCGSHSELLKRCDVYKSLYEKDLNV